MLARERRGLRAIARGADFLDRRLAEEGVIYGVTTGFGDSCTVAIEPEIRDFAYRYDRPVEGDVFDIRPGSDSDAQPLSTITPSIRFTLALTVYDAGNKVLLRKTYESGWVAGEKYIVTSRPHERVNATFHKALQATMEKVAADIRPFFAEDEVER